MYKNNFFFFLVITLKLDDLIINNDVKLFCYTLKILFMDTLNF